MEMIFIPKHFVAPEAKPAFDPELTVVYTGDDYGWPVYAVAVDRFYDRQEQRQRMKIYGLFVPHWNDPGIRPRQASIDYLQGLSKQMKETLHLGLKEAVSRSDIQWLETEVDECKPAKKRLKALSNLRWVAPVFPEGREVIVMHADKVRLDVNFHYLKSMTYEGYVAEDSPGEWANDFVRSLDLCWKPSSTPPPWADTEDMTE